MDRKDGLDNDITNFIKSDGKLQIKRNFQQKKISKVKNII